MLSFRFLNHRLCNIYAVSQERDTYKLYIYICVEMHFRECFFMVFCFISSCAVKVVMQGF